ncbi:MAG: V-type ATPase subunit [Nitrosopumilaceae archaeon]|nr:V-type ATPase subunit [Nitrosopumilaceae archaeon]
MGKSVYASVKAYSKKGKLLARSDFQTLAESRDLDELMTRIKNTTYADAVSEVQKPYTSQGIESALRGHLAEVHHSIARTAGGSSRLLDAYYMKFIITNLKIILKGKVLGKSQEELERHLNLRAEELIKQRDVVVKALVAKDLEEAVASLGSAQFGEDIARAAAAYNDKKNIQVFDTYFDKILYRQLGSAIQGTRELDATRLIGMDVDFYNLLSVARGKLWGLDDAQIEDLIVSSTPLISRELLGRMISAGTVSDAFAELSATRYKVLVPDADNDLDAVARFERAFEMAIYAASARAFTRMFSFATVIGITKLTSYEVRNMAAIAYAVEQGIPAETTMSKLILHGE